MSELRPHYLGNSWRSAHKQRAAKNVHAVAPAHGDNFNKSLCGKTPAPKSLGWLETSKNINCKKCLSLIGENNVDQKMP